jgi:hypothetical protein
MDSVRRHIDDEGKDVFSLEADKKPGQICLTPFPGTLESVDIEAPDLKKRRLTGKQCTKTVFVKVEMPGYDPQYFQATPSNSALFWKLMSSANDSHSPEPAAPPTLAFGIAKTKVDVSFSNKVFFHGKETGGKRNGKMTLEISYPVLSNNVEMEKWTVLTAPTTGLPLQLPPSS